ncbi:hypothetical protein [Culturomica massiliensis]|jgi:hypothetical protein|uniref:hypothetical protein n=1 Tax=Culturomica massiliensis TaxID=1841857 RepID=UPI000E55D54F|nr:MULTISPECIES: hypothetical protein [Odoribacteraceae]RHV90834.1 hypothetical protein DXA95_14925 [Odoribacter sp. OF09-27XD]
MTDLSSISDEKLIYNFQGEKGESDSVIDMFNMLDREFWSRDVWDYKIKNLQEYRKKYFQYYSDIKGYYIEFYKRSKKKQWLEKYIKFCQVFLDKSLFALNQISNEIAVKKANRSIWIGWVGVVVGILSIVCALVLFFIVPDNVGDLGV